MSDEVFMSSYFHRLIKTWMLFSILWKIVRFSFCFFVLSVPIDANDDPVLHTCQTVGRLSNKVARRVYRTVSRQVKLLKKEDVHEYVASLIAVLRLTQYLNFINEKVQAGQSTLAIDNEHEKNEQNKQQKYWIADGKTQ